MNILIIHGPNLNLLGNRETDLYGSVSLADLNKRIIQLAEELGMNAEIIQSNSEGELVNVIQGKAYDFLIINPAAYTHTSIAIRDAVSAVGKPAIEVHISNIYKREAFRQKSFISEVVTGQISGLGTDGYLLALRAAHSILAK
jgi:3-dehydroquinate dehydratase-2